MRLFLAALGLAAATVCSAAAHVGNPQYGYSGSDTISEPGMLLLLGSGLIGIAYYRRRRT